MRVELFDGEGNRYAISFEGQITRDKALRLLDLVELLGGTTATSSSAATSSSMRPVVELKKIDKLRTVVQKHFPLVWFSSRDAQTAFEQEYTEPIALSTVATYMARMVTKRVLEKTGPSNSLKYRVLSGVPRTVIEQRL
jgi:hypothetical protein